MATVTQLLDRQNQQHLQQTAHLQQQMAAFMQTVAPLVGAQAKPTPPAHPYSQNVLCHTPVFKHDGPPLLPGHRLLAGPFKSARLPELNIAEDAYLLAPLNASDIAAFEAGKTYIFPEHLVSRGDPNMPRAMIHTIGQRNALLYYGQKTQAALEEAVHQLAHYKTETYRCHQIIHAHRAMIPTSMNPPFPTITTHVRSPVTVAPTVAEYLAYCHVPLDPNSTYGTLVDKLTNIDLTPEVMLQRRNQTVPQPAIPPFY
jgi:hypothetical protein